MSVLSYEAVEAIDRSSQIDDILSMPEHIRDALWRVESAAIPALETHAGLVIAGMGGSAIGGMLAIAALGDRASLPITCARSYCLPAWVTPDTTVLCASYSGNTEETLACYEAAGVVGANRVVATTGGQLAALARQDGVPVIPLPAALQPRAAVAYMTVAALEVAALCGAGQKLNSELDVAAAHAEELIEEWGPGSSDSSEIKTLARALNNTIPLIAGSGITGPIAYRWKTQINENAKMPCFNHVLPELNHNEIVGWTDASSFGRFSAIFLDDSDLHPRVRERIKLTGELIEPEASGVFHVRSRGESCTERVFSLVLYGDLLSIYLAVLRGIDPSPVDKIVELKSRLEQSAAADLIAD